MANQALKEALQSKGGADVYAVPDHLIVIAEEDPKHANHSEHMLRVEPTDPDNVALLASLNTHGWLKSHTIAVYKDGKRFVVSNGRRGLTFTRIENARRKKDKDPRGPIRPRVVLDDDPLLTETIANSMRKDDPPMVKARRFVQLRDGGMGAQKAAAALGLSLANGNALALILSAPNPAMHAAVNSKSVAVDVALRATKAGSEAVAKVLDAATGDDGKVDGEKAKTAVKDATTARVRSVNRATVAAMSTILIGRGGHTISSHNAGALLAYLNGDREQTNGNEWLARLTADAETAVRDARGGVKGAA